MKKIFLALAITAGVIIGGCTEKKPLTPVQQPEATQEQPKIKEEPKESKPSEQTTAPQTESVESKDLASRNVEEIPGMFKDIYFDYDRYDIREDAKITLKSVADYLIKNGGIRVLIEGHCDSRGTSEYNLGLGERRAKAARDYLLSLGVPSARIEAISYGKEKPVCDTQSEDCWAKNRRARFVLLKARK